MKAVRIYRYDTPEGLVYEDALRPRPGPGEVLVRVQAVGLTPGEIHWPGVRKTSSGADRTLPIIPGHELSGVVDEVGPAVRNVVHGSEVYALIDFTRDGADAEYTIALPAELALKPRKLDHLQAAAVPLSALTAWQALVDQANLAAGQTVLIHGAAGGVGSFAVQIARAVGADVIGIASPRNSDFVRQLGASNIIDYTSTRFEEAVRGVDVVFDTVGGETLERSYAVLKKGGVIVSIAGIPSQKLAETYGIRARLLIVRPDGKQLELIGKLINRERIRPIISQVFPLSEARQAFERGQGGHTRGKVVLQVAALGSQVPEARDSELVGAKPPS